MERENARRANSLPSKAVLGFVPERPLRDLNSDDWCYLAKDLALLVSVMVAGLLPGFRGGMADFCLEDDCTCSGFAFLNHLPTDENLTVLLTQDSPGVARFGAHVATSLRPGVIPQALLEEVRSTAQGILLRETVVYTLTFSGERQGCWTDYAWSEAHMADKIALQLPEGCSQCGPTLISQHASTAEALAFAHALNKRAGVLFGGVGYEHLPALLAP